MVRPGLANAVDDYVESAQATDAVYGLLKMTGNTLPLDEEMSSCIESRYTGKVHCRTAQHWLKKLGFPWHKAQKGGYCYL